MPDIKQLYNRLTVTSTVIVIIIIDIVVDVYAVRRKQQIQFLFEGKHFTVDL